MHKERFEFQNRHDLKIVGDIWHSKQSKGFAFVQHGTGSSRTRPHIECLANILSRNHYTTVTFDSTHSFGESGGALEHATWTTHRDDLEDVILWSQKHASYQEPFILTGHSLGGFASLCMTLKYPDKIKALAPLSTCFSGAHTYDAAQSESSFEQWKKQGYQERTDRLRPEIKGRLMWAWIENAKTYNLLPDAKNITCPVLMMVGENDTATPYQHQKEFFDALDTRKEIFAAPNCGHSFSTKADLEFLENHFETWLQSLKP